MADIVAARISEDFLNRAQLSGVVHSRFQAVLNVNFAMPEETDCLLTVLPPRFTGIPDSLVVGEDYFCQLAALPVGTKVKKESFTFIFATLSEQLYGGDTCLRRHSFGPEAVCWARLPFDSGGLNQFLATLRQFRRRTGRADGFAVLPANRRSEIEILLRQFGAALLTGETGQLESLAAASVGLGKGLTPSADDALVGIMAVVGGARAYGCLESGARAEMPVISDVAALMKKLKGRTTDVSLKYLRCAAEGRFSEVLLDLVAGLFNGDYRNWEGLIAAVAQVGGTSGWDMLHGVEVGCELVSQRTVP